jgi:hypothetical protein
MKTEIIPPAHIGGEAHTFRSGHMKLLPVRPGYWTQGFTTLATNLAVAFITGIIVAYAFRTGKLRV